MLSLQGNQSNTMTIFVTPDHDKQFTNHDRLVELIVELIQDSDCTEEELEELDTIYINDGHYDVYGDESSAC